MREEQKRQFFAMKKEKPHTIKVGGKFGFASLPKHMQETIKKRLAEKDKVIARGLKGEFPGIKIDGKQLTRENLHEFEKSSMPKVKIEKKKEEVKEIKYVKKDLEKLSFSKLKKIAKKLGETGRSKSGLIKDILKHN